MSLPLSLAYALQKISGYSTNYFRLETTNQDTATNNSTITLNLPTNAIINLKSLAMHCEARANETNITIPGGTDFLRTMLPNGIEKLISRVECTAGGIQIQSGFNGYSTVSTVLDNLQTTLNKEISYQRVLQNQEIEVTDLDYYKTFRPFIIQEFRSFIGESEPSYLDTSLLPQIQLRFYLHGPEVLGAVQNSLGLGNSLTDAGQQALISNGRFTLQKLYFTIETITFSNGVYDSAVDAKLKRDGFLEIPFKNYYSFTSSHDGMNKSTRFSLSSQSIDEIYAVQRLGDYQTKSKGLIQIDNKIGPTFIPSYFDFKSGRLGSGQFNVNNLYIPNYRSDALGYFNSMCVAKADQYMTKCGCKVNSFEDWVNHYFTFMIRMNMPSDMGVRSMSGLDSRGINTQMYLETSEGTNTTEEKITNNEVFVFCACTSVLRVGMGRMIELIV